MSFQVDGLRDSDSGRCSIYERESVLLYRVWVDNPHIGIKAVQSSDNGN